MITTTHLTSSRIGRGVGASVVAAAIALGMSLSAQSVPEIAFDANIDLLKLPDNVHLGEVAGVATNSKGHIFVYTRTGAPNATVGTSRTFFKAGSKLFEFDQTGKFVREIGQGLYGLNFAQAARVDPQDNVWLVDQGSSNVMKFDADGRLQLVLSRKPEAISVRPLVPVAGRGAGAPGAGAPGGGAPAAGAPGAGAPGAGAPSAGAPTAGTGAPAAAPPAQGGGRLGPPGPPGSGIPGDSFNRTADVTWDRAGNIYVADGASRTVGNARIAKFDKDGHFIKSWGSRGSEPGQFNGIRGIVIDAQGNLYALTRRRASGSSTATATSRPRSPISASPRRFASRRDRTSISTARTRTIPRRWQRRNLQARAQRQGRRKIRAGRKAAEGIRHGQLVRLPQRERALRRRTDQLAGSESVAARGEVAGHDRHSNRSATMGSTLVARRAGT